MLSRRIIACLDVRDGVVVKGVKFRNHRIVGEIEELALRYSAEGADELVFYDISASPDSRVVDRNWVKRVARLINIPFCVAGGIKSLADAEAILECGADKVSINSMALNNPALIDELAVKLGSQCVVVGIDSRLVHNEFRPHQFTGSVKKSLATTRETSEWVREVQSRGAGEVVLNAMSNDGVGLGFDLAQTRMIRTICKVPLIASGGAGRAQDFFDVFDRCDVDGALAAGVFHSGEIQIQELKTNLKIQGLEIRL